MRCSQQRTTKNSSVKKAGTETIAEVRLQSAEVTALDPSNICGSAGVYFCNLTSDLCNGPVDTLLMPQSKRPLPTSNKGSYEIFA